MKTKKINIFEENRHIFLQAPGKPSPEGEGVGHELKEMVVGTATLNPGRTDQAMLGQKPTEVIWNEGQELPQNIAEDFKNEVVDTVKDVVKLPTTIVAPFLRHGVNMVKQGIDAVRVVTHAGVRTIPFVALAATAAIYERITRILPFLGKKTDNPYKKAQSLVDRMPVIGRNKES